MYPDSVDWDSIPLQGLCPRTNCEVPITMHPPGTAGGYTLPEHRWRCVQHYVLVARLLCLVAPTLLMSSEVHPWAGLQDLLPPAAPACSRVYLALHGDSFDVDSVPAHCLPWLLVA
jgi:hypothetical protein